jgi:hypothetical protein
MGTKRVTWALLLLLAVLGVVQCTPEEKEVKVKEVSLSKTTLSLEVGKDAKLTATVASEDATNAKVT